MLDAFVKFWDKLMEDPNRVICGTHFNRPGWCFDLHAIKETK